MSKWEKIFILSYFFLFAPVCFYWGAKDADVPVFLCFLAAAVGLTFLIIIFRDIYKRQFPNPNSKVTWTILILVFFPAVVVYLFKYGFKPRQRTQV